MVQYTPNKSLKKKNLVGKTSTLLFTGKNLLVDSVFLVYKVGCHRKILFVYDSFKITLLYNTQIIHLKKIS